MYFYSETAGPSNTADVVVVLSTRNFPSLFQVSAVPAVSAIEDACRPLAHASAALLFHLARPRRLRRGERFTYLDHLEYLPYCLERVGGIVHGEGYPSRDDKLEAVSFQRFKVVRVSFFFPSSSFFLFFFF